MDTIAAANVLAYCVQAATVAVFAALLPSLLRLDRATARYRIARAALALCLALPWLQLRQPAPQGGSRVLTSITSATGMPVPVTAPSAATVAWPSPVLTVVLAGIVLRLGWLAVGLVRLRRLRTEGVPMDPADRAAVLNLAGAAADLRVVDGLPQPVTFGYRRPVVLLPGAIRGAAPAIRDAVVLHELIHVRRQDWLSVLAEEILRALFWFHPPLRWLIARIQQAREEIVDARVVSLTGQRRTYIEALISFADARTPVAPVSAFGRPRHLFRRIVLISREPAMSNRRVAVSSAAIAAIVLAAAWTAMGAFPFTAAYAAQQLLSSPGPLEQAAVPIGTDNPIPERTRYVAPEYPDLAASDNAFAYVTLRITLDATGSVAEERLSAFSLKTPRFDLRIPASDHAQHDLDAFLEKDSRPDVPRPLIAALIDAAASAVGQWRYAPPAQAPIAFDVSISFAPAAGGVASATAGNPPPEWTDAIRVNGVIKPPTKVKHVSPIYPPEVMAAKIQGVVILDIKIGGDGRVADVHVLRSIPELDQAAIDAVRQWEFTPTLLNGAPTAVAVTVTVSFTLK